MRIAVVGSGISGLGAAWLLSQKYQVHLFEADNRLGGHANTVHVQEQDNTFPVDTGFLVYNELTYPNLTRFFKTLDVETTASDMSLAVRIEDKNFEWNGTNLNTIFAQRSNLLKPKFYIMLLEILRFGREAQENLYQSRRRAWTLSELLTERKFSKNFIHEYLLPIGAAIWSTAERRILDFPAANFLTFFINHKLLQVNNRPVWRTVKNGSEQYVKKAATAIYKIHLNTPVIAVERSSNVIKLRTDKERLEFDKVVMATHAPTTARLVHPTSDKEKQVLSSIQYAPNTAFLHTDSTHMPQRKLCWGSWNVFGNELAKSVTLSYYLNKLQPIVTNSDYFITLNPVRTIKNTLLEINYEHPQFDQQAIRAQRELPDIQGNGGVYFAGAWSRYGFHEDGLLSAMNVARLLGVKIPWEVEWSV